MAGRFEMLGSYATAELDKNSRLGVIAVQDESAALTSVSDMRWQTLWISLVAGLLTILIGIFFANKLTYPVRELAGGAHRIAGGDFSQRIQITSRTELGDLGNSFNVMTDQVERFISDLQKSSEENRQLFLGTVKGSCRSNRRQGSVYAWSLRTSFAVFGCDRAAHGIG
jgi:methyl-accepting chemotaxis protein